MNKDILKIKKDMAAKLEAYNAEHNKAQAELDSLRDELADINARMGDQDTVSDFNTYSALDTKRSQLVKYIDLRSRWLADFDAQNLATENESRSVYALMHKANDEIRATVGKAAAKELSKILETLRNALDEIFENEKIYNDYCEKMAGMGEMLSHAEGFDLYYMLLSLTESGNFRNYL